jgi:hypothetical protein
MPIVGGLDIHRKQLTFDYLDTVSGEVKRGQVAPADRVHLRGWLARFMLGDRKDDWLAGCLEDGPAKRSRSPTKLTCTPSSAARSRGRCKCPLTRRNWRPASIIPAAQQRSAICPPRQRLTFLLCSRQMVT